MQQQFDNTVSNYLSFIDNNEYISTALSLFLILYAGLAAPQLPEYVARLFDNPLFKLVIFFLIAYSARKNPTVAIIASVGLMVSLYTLTRFKINRQMVTMVKAEENAAIQEAAMEAAIKANGRIEAMEDIAGMNGPYDMESVVMPQDNVPDAALMELQAEAGAPTCGKSENYRNNFYPQYVNMKPDAYMARSMGGDVAGYDTSAKYAGI